jgi:type II restriction/modification system DNA methylase subunit YeeA
MDKNAIKKYAVWARKELISRVAQKAQQYGITETEMVDAGADSVNGKVLSAEEMQQRRALIVQINEKGYQQVMEEVAYTWFNRFSALRFMEVNGYLPSHVRVFTDENNAFKPQILAEALHLELDKLDKDKVYALKETEQTEELYKYLLIVQCNALNSILPGMFQTIADYTELLLPDNLLREGSVIEQMISQIPEDNWQDAVQIIGWLYQYYNSEKKDDVFAALKKNVKITKENIPAATQLFTPDWIVRYMVENSLGRLWVEGHPDAKAQLLPTPEEQAAYTAGNRDPEDTKWHYYLEEAQQEPQVQAQLSEIRKQYADLIPEQIKVIDPCCGSGHILAYLFDVLMQIYENYGYTPRDAVTSILQNNLYGLDIDDRAAQLAYFAVMMKARRYDRRFFSHTTQPHVYAIEESNRIEKPDVEYFCNGKLELKDAMHTILTQLHDAKEYGSILTITPQDWDALYARFDEVADESSFHRESIRKKLLPLVRVAQTLAQKYDVVVTNPPYMGASNMNSGLSEYVKKYYPDSKSDLFAVFIEVCSRMAKQNGYQAMITQHAWMFLSSFEKLREKMMLTETVSMAHLGARAFEEIGGEVVQTTSFVRVRTHIDNYKGVYCRLIEPTTQQGKEDMFLACENRYIANQDNFAKIPGSPVAYWVSNNFLKAFDNEKIGKYTISDGQTKTGNNDKYLRLLWEVPVSEIGKGKHWVLHAKGGAFRRWYGNIDTLIDWSDSAREHYRTDHVARIAPEYIWFRKGICWTLISSNKLHGFRLLDDNSTFNLAAPSVFFNNDRMMFYILGYLNSKFSQEIIALLNPTLNTNISDITAQPLYYGKLPEQEDMVINLVSQNIALSKADWDSFETSWDFTRHPFIKAITKYPNMMDVGNIYLAECYDIWAGECEERFEKLKANEEELNRIFIDIYGLQDELTPEVEDKDVTVRKADLGRDVRSFISYAVGCMFGRYSPTYDGLAYAGGTWDDGKYNIYKPDADGIIPICDDEYFEDDMMGRFVEFVRVVYGDSSLEDNLRFIANALGGKGQPKEVIRNYLLNDFYADHCKIYQKRPIYWLFDSGKKNGFKCLIYLHRYQPDTIARIRTDYVHEQQARYRTAIEGLEKQVAAATSTSERVKLTKQLNKVQAQDAELHQYEEKVHALADQMIKIDLDDGVKHNYEIFKDVLAKIK